MHRCCEVCDTFGAADCTRAFGLTEIFKLARHFGDSFVKYVPNKSPGLPQHFSSLF